MAESDRLVGVGGLTMRWQCQWRGGSRCSPGPVVVGDRLSFGTSPTFSVGGPDWSSDVLNIRLWQDRVDGPELGVVVPHEIALDLT